MLNGVLLGGGLGQRLEAEAAGLQAEVGDDVEEGPDAELPDEGLPGRDVLEGEAGENLFPRLQAARRVDDLAEAPVSPGALLYRML